jgi:hypothetical protein
MPGLSLLEIWPEYLDKAHFRNPPRIEPDADGILRYLGERDEPELPARASPTRSLISHPIEAGLHFIPDAASATRRALGLSPGTPSSAGTANSPREVHSPRALPRHQTNFLHHDHAKIPQGASIFAQASSMSISAGNFGVSSTCSLSLQFVVVQ